jgi:hypothetical protein
MHANPKEIIALLQAGHTAQEVQTVLTLVVYDYCI